jgi:hypothetical protein
MVVAMTLDLVPHPTLTVAELTFAAADAPRMLADWQRWSARLPQTAISGIAPSADGRALTIRLAHVGERCQVRALLASLRAAVAAPVLAESAGPTTVAQIVAQVARLNPAA